MHDKLEMAHDKFISALGALAAGVGVNQFIAQLYGVLYLSDKPLSLDELAAKLKASKGNVSTNIRELERWGAVRGVWIKGSRKDYYEAEPDIKKVAFNKIKSGMIKRMDRVSGIIDEVKSLTAVGHDVEISQEDKKRAKFIGEKIRQVEQMKELASKAIGLADKFF